MTLPTPDLPIRPSIRMRIFGRLAGQKPQSGVPLSISWERAFERLEQLPRMFAEPDGSFLWSGGREDESDYWRLEGTLFDDGQVVRRIELVGNCPTAQWQEFLSAIESTWDSVTVELLDDNLVESGQWLRVHALDAHRADGTTADP